MADRILRSLGQKDLFEWSASKTAGNFKFCMSSIFPAIMCPTSYSKNYSALLYNKQIILYFGASLYKRTSHFDKENVCPRCRRPFIYGYGKVTKYFGMLNNYSEHGNLRFILPFLTLDLLGHPLRKFFLCPSVLGFAFLVQSIVTPSFVLFVPPFFINMAFKLESEIENDSTRISLHRVNHLPTSNSKTVNLPNEM